MYYTCVLNPIFDAVYPRFGLFRRKNFNGNECHDFCALAEVDQCSLTPALAVGSLSVLQQLSSRYSMDVPGQICLKQQKDIFPRTCFIQPGLHLRNSRSEDRKKAAAYYLWSYLV